MGREVEPSLQKARDHARYFFSKQYYKYSIQCFIYNSLCIDMFICKYIYKYINKCTYNYIKIYDLYIIV